MKTFATSGGTYSPSKLEYDIMEVSRSDLRYDVDGADGCGLFTNTSGVNFYDNYLEYSKMLNSYTTFVREFNVSTISDIRQAGENKYHEICKAMDVVLHTAFQTESSLSSTQGGYVEPLLPPFRHPRMCQYKKASKRREWLLNIEYLVHDFGKICRNLSRTSRTAFLDIGASLEFHPGVDSPALELLRLYSKFGIKFDHYYAFEYTAIPPHRVFNAVPENLLPSYHWFNVPVEVSSSSKQNPWASILSAFSVDDFVAVKLDIDTPSVELPLVHQLLNRKYSKLVDQFYFEHHVKMKPMESIWQETANGTVQDSLDLFTNLRESGIAAHSWV